MRLRLAHLLAIVIIASHAGPAWAWGPQGHRVITRVAESRLTPEANRAIRELLLSGDNLVDLSGWADKEGHDAVPGSAEWHYVNSPITEPHFVGAGKDRSSGRRKVESVVTKIPHFRAVLADKNAPKKERQRALLFLVHFIEDIHQPLHVGDHDDQGGNLTQVQFFGEGTNLHRLWDSGLIHKIGGDDRAWVRRVERPITPELVKEWSKGGVDEWAEESLQAAKRAYRGPSGKLFLNSGVTLGEPYVKFAEPILEEQMARSAVRLANELNAIFK